MITTKENGVQYSNLDKNILNFHIENNFIIASVERSLNYTNDEYKDYIDDITTQEIIDGLNEVKNYCETNGLTDLLNAYVNILPQDNLELLKEIKLIQVKYAYDDFINKGFKYIRNTYQWDEASLMRINGIATYNKEEQISFIDIENEIVNFSNEEFKEFASAITNRNNQARYNKALLKIEIIQAQAIDDIIKLAIEF